MPVQCQVLHENFTTTGTTCKYIQLACVKSTIQKSIKRQPTCTVLTSTVFYTLYTSCWDLPNSLYQSLLLIQFQLPLLHYLLLCHTLCVQVYQHLQVLPLQCLVSTDCSKLSINQFLCSSVIVAGTSVAPMLPALTCSNGTSLYSSTCFFINQQYLRTLIKVVTALV